MSLSDSESAALAATLAPSHAKQEAKGKFNALVGMAKKSGNTIRKASLGAVDKLDGLLKDKVKLRLFGPSDDKSAEDDNQEKDEASSGARSSSSGRLPPREVLLDAGRMGAACFVVYLLGYFAMGLLYVVIPVVSFALFKTRKQKKAEKLAFHRRVAVEGEEAVLRSSLAELPSWLSFPDVERVEWLNTMLAALWPHVTEYADRTLRTTVEPMVRETLESYKLWGFKFRSINFGRVPPRVAGVKVYRTPASRDEIVIDVDVEYFGDADIGIALMRVAASVADVQLEGKLRIILKPLIGDLPVVGGVQIFFLRPPEVSFDFGGAASVLDMPGINSLLKDAVNDQIANNMILPNKITVMLTDKISAEDLRMPRPVGVLVVKVLEARNLMQTDTLTAIDPYVCLQHGVRERRTAVASGRSPRWNEAIEFAIEVPESEEIQVTVLDRDTLSSDDFLGQARLNVCAVAKEGAVQSWINLDGAESGQLHLKLFWLRTSDRHEDYAASAHVKHARALLLIYFDSCNIIKNGNGNGVSPPRLRAVLSCSEDSQHTKTSDCLAYDAVFQEGFVIHLRQVEGEVLHIKLEDTDDGGAKAVGEFNFHLSDLVSAEDMTRRLETYELAENRGQVRLAARLKYLVRVKEDAREVAGIVNKASHLAGSSMKAVGGAAKNLGFVTTDVAKGVGSVTTSAVKSVGSATTGAVGFLGTSSLNIVKKVSPISSPIKPETEASPRKGDEDKLSPLPVKPTVLETNLDELPSPTSSVNAVKEKKKSHDGVRKFSDGFKFKF